jgi:uncharacterized membrane protein YkvA (DUF1232 family)
MVMLRALWHQIWLTLRLMRDSRVPLWVKGIPVAALVYVLSPIDLLPDVIVGLGQLDDLGLMLAAMRLMESFTPEYIVSEYRQRIKDRSQADVVNAPSYRVSRSEEERTGV